jgi:hypothetical protein
VAPAPSIPSYEVCEALASSYEELREIALTSVGVLLHGRGTGFALFIRRGMASWMQTCIGVLAQPTAPTAFAPRQIEEPPYVPAEVRLDVAMILAQMALATQPNGAMTC